MSGMLAGQCLCGAVHYAVDAPPIWCAHCHCTLCQRAHGAAFVTWVGVPHAAFCVTAGGSALKWRASTLQAMRAFCSECGTPMLFHGERWVDEMHIARATLTSTLGMPPKAHAYYDTHVAWAHCDDALPRYDAAGQPMEPDQ